MKIHESMTNVLPALRQSQGLSMGEKSAATLEDPQEKQLRNMQEGLQRLRAMPSPQKLAKQQAQNKVGYLQRRLDALKMMLLHASPEQAKALARELKEIAGQLASAAKSAGGRSSAGNAAQTASGSEAVPADAQGAAAETPADIAEIERAAVDRSKAEAANRREVPLKPGNAGQTPANEEEIDNAVLRGLLLDAKKLLKEVIDMLKPKLAAAGKEAKDDLREAEKKLAEMGKAMQQSATPTTPTTPTTTATTADCYGAGAGFSLSGVALTVSISSGLNISVSV